MLVFAYSHANTPCSQSDRAYNVNNFINNNVHIYMFEREKEKEKEKERELKCFTMIQLH